MCVWAVPGFLDAPEAPGLAHGQLREEEVSHVASVNPPGTSPHGFHHVGKKSWPREPGREQGSQPCPVTGRMSTCNPTGTPWVLSCCHCNLQELVVELPYF